jgi:MOSC domain
MTPGRFGENFTASGMADDEVCIGDQFRIGEALVEVAQPLDAAAESALLCCSVPGTDVVLDL